jgi:oxygen-dependent protoporphyrinogen oxidase
MGDQIVAAPSNASRMHVLHRGQPRRVPLDPLTFLTTPLLSAQGKMRMLAEPFIAPRRDEGDESLAAFVDRRLGQEARENFIGPILAGIYNTDPATQSILSTAPVMRELEREGSLVRGALVRMLARRKSAPPAQRPPQFISFRSGAQALSDQIRRQLHAGLRGGVAAQTVTPLREVILANGERLAADAVVLGVPANDAAQLLADAPVARALLGRIRHNDIGTLTLVYRTAALPDSLVMSGLMIPRREGRAIDAVTCLHSPSERLPAGFTLLKIFFGGGQPATVALSDEALLAVVRRELDELLGIQAEPVLWRAFRWHASFPQADVGHEALIAQIEQALPPGIFLAGAAYRGIGVPDCIRQAEHAAQAVVHFLQQDSGPDAAPRGTV